MLHSKLNTKDGMLLAHEFFAAGRFAEAARVYQGVAIAENGNFDAVHGVGVCHQLLKDYAESIVWLDRAGRIALTQLITTALNKAVALGELGRSHEALHTLDGLLRLCPDHAQALYNRGILRMQVEQFHEAIDDFERSLALDPAASYGNVEYARGFANLVLGNYLDGFRDFEHREKDAITTTGEEWTGKQCLYGKTILVHAEMGSGDTIQFSRYLPLMVAKHAHVIAVVHPGIRPLLEGMPGVTFCGEDEPLPAADYWIRLMSLARAFRTEAFTVPPPTPINYNEDYLWLWRNAYSRGAFNVGLCWSGNTKSKYDVHRSIPAKLLAPLVALSERMPVQFYSLQQEVRESDRAAFEAMDIASFGAGFDDFRDTAHAMKHLDLMITCDTSVAHMAGTVGIPTWVLLTKFRTYWLWMQGRDTTPWYSSMSCWKQKTDGDWPEVIARVTERLADLVEAHNGIASPKAAD